MSSPGRIVFVKEKKERPNKINNTTSKDRTTK